jgi:hypothetical protein
LESQPNLHNTQLQSLFYESSREWVLSLKERYDPGDLLGILDNDTDLYPFQTLGSALVPAYQPSFQEIRTEGGKRAIQERILSRVESDADEVMGPGAYNSFVSGMVNSRNLTHHSESSLKTIYGRLRTPHNNVAAIAYHPNIMALPIYAGGIASALNEAEFMNGTFDLFSFNQQNLIIANPALSVASYKGRPVMETMSEFSTVIQAIPPTRSGLAFYNDRSIRKAQSKATRDAIDNYLNHLYSQNKSAYLTVDPTGSTSEPIIKEGRIVAMKRKPVNRAAKLMIMSDFYFTWPMTMVLGKNGASWRIGDVNAIYREEQFDQMIEQLDQQTEEISMLKLNTVIDKRQMGKTALGSSIDKN